MFRTVVVVTGWLVLVASAQAAVNTKKIAYKHGDLECQGYLAWDDAVKGPRPGVLVVHEWWGLNDYARGRAEQLAKLGYVAFAADMYGEGKEAGVAQANLVESVPAAQYSDDEAKLPGTALRWSPLGRPLYLLVMSPAVQAELKLNEGQKKALATLQSEIVKPLRSWRELDWDERDRRYASANEQTKKGLPKILDGRQLQRLHEIDLQQRGYRGILADEEIVAKLKLTAERRRALVESMEVAELKTQRLSGRLLDVNDVYKNYKEEMAEERRNLIQELVKLHADGYQRLQAGLTEEQQKLFRAMLGKHFDTAALLEAIN